MIGPENLNVDIHFLNDFRQVKAMSNSSTIFRHYYFYYFGGVHPYLKV
jgi:hypothetical protein